MKKKERPRVQTKRKKHSFLKVFAIFMIVVGILILLYPIAGNYLANRERSQAVTEYDDTLKKMTEAERAAQLALAEQYNTYLFQKQEGLSPAPMVYDNVISKGTVMGTIDIPAIGIEQMPFYHGTSFKTLNKGLGHFEPSSIPVGGENTRAVITGHSGVQNQVLFSDIKNLSEGDIFFINILGKRLAYEIEAFEEVLPTDVDKVNIRSGKDQVTLLTCTPPGINTFRLLVTGHRIPYEEAIQKKVTKRNRWNYQTVVLLTLGLGFVIFMLLMIIYRYQLRRFRSNDPQISEKARKNLKRLLLITKTLFVLLFIAMVTVVSFAIYGYYHMEQDPELPSINVGQRSELSQYNLDKIAKANYEERQIASVSISEYATAKSMIQQTTNNWGVGKLIIPEVGLDLPVLAGISNQNLLSGAATYRLEQQLGKGNYVLLAHSIYGKDVLLHRIQYLKEGNLVYVTDFQDVYVYEVSLNKVIEETEVSYIEQNTEGDAAKLSLLRCEGDVGTIYRRLVQGNLKSILPLKEADEELFQELNLEREKAADYSKILKKNPVTPFEQFCMTLTAKIVSDPMQTVVPLFLMLLLPILFFSLI